MRFHLFCVTFYSSDVMKVEQRAAGSGIAKTILLENFSVLAKRVEGKSTSSTSENRKCFDIGMEQTVRCRPSPEIEIVVLDFRITTASHEIFLGLFVIQSTLNNSHDVLKSFHPFLKSLECFVKVCIKIKLTRESVEVHCDCVVGCHVTRSSALVLSINFYVRWLTLHIRSALSHGCNCEHLLLLIFRLFAVFSSSAISRSIWSELSELEKPRNYLCNQI